MDVYKHKSVVVRCYTLFRATFTAVSKFRYIAQTLAKITDEAPFYATPDGLEAKILSPDKTTLTILKIPAIAFEEYSVDQEEFFVVATDELNKTMRRGTRDDVMELVLDKENNRLRIVFRNKKTGVERSFYIELKPRTPEHLPEPKLDLGVSFRIVPDDYKQIIRDLKIIGEEAVFHYKGGKIHIYSYAQQKEYRGEFSEGSPLSYVSATVEEAKSTYSVGLLEATLKPVQAASDAIVSFDTNKPIKIEFTLAAGGSLIYWIVPRIEA